MEKKIAFAQSFLNFNNKCKSVYHSVNEIEIQLKNAGFSQLELTEDWEIELGQGYYVKRNDSTIIALNIPKNIDDLTFKIVANHIDTPGFKIKPNPTSISEGYIRFNTEVYGGPILNTWMDRPLSFAGRVLVKGKNPMTPKTILVDMEKPLMVIPNVAIHQNQTVNDGIKLTKQNDMLPVISHVEREINKSELLLDLIESKLSVSRDEILDAELYLYQCGDGMIFGAEDQFINAPKIDNLASVYSGLCAFLETEAKKDINVLCCFDNEECGSRTPQGADTRFLYNILERLFKKIEISQEKFYQSLYKSFIISTDGAHGIHPAKSSKSDITNKPMLNEGVVIKHSSNKSYATDGFSSAVIKGLAQENEIKIQEFVNNSDERGGTTLGPIMVGHLDINCVDLGIPMLAMHSVRETAGVSDIFELKKLLESFYSIVI